MTKVRCTRCEVVNLDRFVTYPFCAGCGARLPAPPREPAWGRPLGPMLWASLLCGGALGLFASVALLNGDEDASGRLMVIGKLPQTARAGQSFPLRLTVDQEGFEGAPSVSVLQNLSVRLPGKSSRAYDVMSVQPSPDVQEVVGSGRYYRFESLPRGEQLIFVLRPRRPGNIVVTMLLAVPEQTSTDFRAHVSVLPGETRVSGVVLKEVGQQTP